MNKFFILLLFLPYCILSQNHKIIYECSLNSNDFLNKIENSRNDTLVKYKTQLNKLLKNSDNIYFELIFNNIESVFLKKESMNGNENKINLLRIKYGREKIYTNIKDDIFLKQIDAYGELFLINIAPNKVTWKLINKTKNINNHLCYKAVATIKTSKNIKNIIAWYNPNINVSFGPLSYYGLPGLIEEVLIDDNKFITIFKAIKFIKNTKEKIIEPKKGKKVTLKEFNIIGKQVIENMKRNR